MRARLEIITVTIGIALSGPALAFPGPMRLAEAQIPKQIPMQRTAAEYATHIAMDGLLEDASAKLALQKSKSVEVRKFANLLIQNQAKSKQQLKLAVGRSPAHPVLPTALDNSHAALLEQLKQASGVEFETRFIQQRIDAYVQSLELHHAYARRGEDTALKQFASAAQTQVEIQLAAAQKISHSLGGLQPRA